MINDIKYGVYVVTYEKALTPEEKTVSAMSQVYLDPSVANEDITELCNELGNEWHMYVVAEGVQAAGFANAYDALNRSFARPVLTTSLGRQTTSNILFASAGVPAQTICDSSPFGF